MFTKFAASILFAALSLCAPHVAGAGELTDSNDRTNENSMNAHIDSQLSSGKVACDGLPKLSAGAQSLCRLLRDAREEKELDQTCRAKKLKGPAFKKCAEPIRHKYRLRDE